MSQCWPVWSGTEDDDNDSCSGSVYCFLDIVVVRRLVHHSEKKENAFRMIDMIWANRRWPMAKHNGLRKAMMWSTHKSTSRGEASLALMAICCHRHDRWECLPPHQTIGQVLLEEERGMAFLQNCARQ